MAYSKLEQSVMELAAPIAEQISCYIYDVEFSKEGGVQFLRIFADKDEKISLDECEAISRKVSDTLDEMEKAGTFTIKDNYYLEVSSPGAARRLKTAAHFDMYIGKLVEVSLYQAVNSSKRLIGELVAYNNGEVTLNVEKKEIILQKEDYGKISLYFDIDAVLSKS